MKTEQNIPPVKETPTHLKRFLIGLLLAVAATGFLSTAWIATSSRKTAMEHFLENSSHIELPEINVSELIQNNGLTQSMKSVPPSVFQGILTGTDGTFTAVIDGQPFAAGETVNGLHVVRIVRNGMTLKRADRTWDLEPGDSLPSD